jgi:glycosyltransferase involved in cell wall biosynthesis
MTPSPPPVSLGIPTYNRPEGLRRTLERVAWEVWLLKRD